MTSEQQAAYLYGAAEMAANLFRRMGDGERADCVHAWVTDNANLEETDDALLGNPELPAATVLEVLMIRHCGAYQ